MIALTSLAALLLLAPQSRFADVTEASGVRFTCQGGSGRLLVLDTMGSGLACADFDGDGDDDLYLLTGTQLDAYPAGKSAPTNRLFRNDSTPASGPRFADVTAGSGTDVRGWSMGTVAGDYDADGDLDLYVTRYGTNVLLRNDTTTGGPMKFTDVTVAAGVGDPRWGTGAVFFDYDRDGDLDLYAVNYLDFEGRLKRFNGDLDHPDFKEFKQLPHFFEGQPNVLYRNNGDGIFSDVTAQAGVADPKGKGLGAIACDLDDDGDLELYVCNDTTPNSLFVNRGDGTFDEVATETGVALSAAGRPQGSMGIACGDVDGDARFDLLVSTFDNEPKAIYRNEGDLVFLEESHERRLDKDPLHVVSWGCELQDYDNDGDLDAFLANGHVITDVPLFLLRHLMPADRLPGIVEPEHFASSYEQRALLFANDGRGIFSNASKAAGPWFDKPVVGRGAISADLDGDGDLDLVVSRSNEPATVLRNELMEGDQAKAASRSWISITLADEGKNRFGVGARIEVRAGDRKQVRQVYCGDSYLSQHPLAQHFGLGGHSGPVDVAVRWPDGSEQLFEGVATRQRIVLRRAAGKKS